jgi:hypothetical protein
MDSDPISSGLHVSADPTDKNTGDVKELAEHIRTVHFTLLVLCLVLVAIAWRQHPNGPSISRWPSARGGRAALRREREAGRNTAREEIIQLY